MKTRRLALSVAAMLVLSASAFSHHGNAAYEATMTVLTDATVTKLVWANPHTIVQFDVKNEAGELVHWTAELGSPSALTNVGWSKASLQGGEVVTIYIHQAKTKNPVGRIQRIVLADGSTLRDSGGGGDDAGGGRGGRGGRGGAEPQ